MSSLKRSLMLAVCLCLMLNAFALAEDTADEPTHPDAQTLADGLTQLTASEAPSLQSFSTLTLEGETATAELFAEHKLTMINIWGTFCGPCVSEMPDLATLASAYEEGEVQVVGIVIDALSWDGAIDQSVLDAAWLIIEETGASYPHLLPSYDLIQAVLYSVTAVPETIFVDENGTVLTPDTRYLGARDAEDWKNIIDGLLADMDA